MSLYEEKWGVPTFPQSTIDICSAAYHKNYTTNVVALQIQLQYVLGSKQNLEHATVACSLKGGQAIVQ